MSEHLVEPSPVVGVTRITNVGGTPHIEHAGPGLDAGAVARHVSLHPGEALVIHHYGAANAPASPAPEPEPGNTVTLVDHVGAGESLRALGEPEPVHPTDT